MKRKSFVKHCAVCGDDFRPWHSTQRCCSKSCAGRVNSPPAEMKCPICNGVFLVPRGELARRKTCSHKCAAELKRSHGGAHRKGAANPNFKSGRRVGVRDRAGEERWRAALGSACMAPDCPNVDGTHIQPLFLHHICYRQHVRGAGGDEWDPRNGFTICNSCHTRHHRRSRVLPITCLPSAALDFIFELMGPAAEVYLRRYYSGDDRRLALQEVAA